MTTTSSSSAVQRYRGEFPNRREAVRDIRRAVGAIARSCGMDEQLVQDVRLAVSEAATNSIVHGRASSESSVIVRVLTDVGEMCVVVADQGAGMLPRTDSPGLGLGLPIISTVTLRMEVVSHGPDGCTEVHMYFPCDDVRGDVDDAPAGLAGCAERTSTALAD